MTREPSEVADFVRRNFHRWRPMFDEFRKHDRRLDYAAGCRCDECITVAVEDELGEPRRSPR